MAISVKLNDAEIRLGGEFGSALAFVKGFTGRSYDGQAKAWTVPMTLLDFQKSASGRFPIDVLSAANAARSGQHITKYGNKYSANEWSAKREYDAVRLPDALTAEARAREAAAEQALVEALKGFGMGDETIAKLRFIEQRFHGDLAEAEEYGKIRFSSAERREAIESAFARYWSDYLKAGEAVEDFLDAEQRRIDEKYGIY